MTVNIKALVNSLGKSYQEIVNIGIIEYKTKPSGFAGSDVITLDMIKEGVFLAFHRNETLLKEITLTLLDEKRINWEFPNVLPYPLNPLMGRQWMHEKLGTPDKFLPPRKRIKKEVGWTELYSALKFEVPVSMQLDYDLQENVKEITFILTSEVSW
ncbi:DUF6392 family protein [Xenorhabdus innexi]|uniref:Similar to pyocin S3 immunity protein n=1 Tax=Xenorhabdus innexi TaxID=290109 RepID=A0A1N6N200_9GAMM|nr:DUF6392 family protein [Xenorhabdus innexi]PHM29428.1 hypothetical protein Xinn_03696 [Xenorhabdus innexi]SIP75138.1 Similar to pyocin S3 immunity protein [Xenorhabdus innexi]